MIFSPFSQLYLKTNWIHFDCRVVNNHLTGLNFKKAAFFLSHVQVAISDYLLKSVDDFNVFKQ